MKLFWKVSLMISLFVMSLLGGLPALAANNVLWACDQEAVFEQLPLIPGKNGDLIGGGYIIDAPVGDTSAIKAVCQKKGEQALAGKDVGCTVDRSKTKCFDGGQEGYIITCMTYSQNCRGEPGGSCHSAETESSLPKSSHRLGQPQFAIVCKQNPSAPGQQTSHATTFFKNFKFNPAAWGVAQ